MASDLPLIAECHLDLEGLRAQRDRYRAIGQAIQRLERRPGRLEAWLDPGVDVALVGEAIEVERMCCPFFELGFDPNERRLFVSVDEPAHDKALDAISYALTGGG